jgi:hypothetical protein
LNWEQFKRAIEHPYWVRDPMAWQSEGAGIAFFAKECRAGAFNVAFLTLNCDTPPEPRVYREANIAYMLTSAQHYYIGSRTIEHLASILTLPDFCRVLARSPEMMMRSSPLLLTLHASGLKRIAHELQLRRAAR